MVLRWLKGIMSTGYMSLSRVGPSRSDASTRSGPTRPRMSSYVCCMHMYTTFNILPISLLATSLILLPNQFSDGQARNRRRDPDPTPIHHDDRLPPAIPKRPPPIDQPPPRPGPNSKTLWPKGIQKEGDFEGCAWDFKCKGNPCESGVVAVRSRTTLEEEREREMREYAR